MQNVADTGHTVNGVWYPPGGYTNRSDGNEWVDRSYQCTIRRFKSGGVEVCSKLVGGIRYKSFAESAFYGGLVSYKEKPADTRTPEQAEEDQATADKENKLRAIRRARQGVRFAVKAIGADHLLTLTYREDMQDVERLKRDWKEFNRLMRKGLPASENHRSHSGVPEWKFVCIRERQERGAYHLHIAVVGRQDIGFNLPNLYFTLRNCRPWDTAARRRIYRVIAAEKKRLYLSGVPYIEVHLWCRCLCNPRNERSTIRLQAYYRQGQLFNQKAA